MLSDKKNCFKMLKRHIGYGVKDFYHLILKKEFIRRWLVRCVEYLEL